AKLPRLILQCSSGLNLFKDPAELELATIIRPLVQSRLPAQPVDGKPTVELDGYSSSLHSVSDANGPSNPDPVDTMYLEHWLCHLCPSPEKKLLHRKTLWPTVKVMYWFKCWGSQLARTLPLDHTGLQHTTVSSCGLARGLSLPTV
ncbi:hypothetical protein CSPX01_08811, partial [Colletotrichum filicis]